MNTMIKTTIRLAVLTALCGALTACETDEQRLRDAQVAHMVEQQKQVCKDKGLASDSDAYKQCVDEIVKTAKSTEARQDLNKYLASNPWSERP